jgi:hypothetical protein
MIYHGGHNDLWTGIEYENRERVRAVMVGDDREFTFDVDEVTPLAEGDYCPECGQIGCKAYALGEDESDG